MYIWIVVTFLLITMTEILATSQDDVTSVCWATTNAPEGQNASITCHFGKDISKLRSDARVYHYRPNPEPLLTVLWLNGRPQIITRSGYEMNGNITTSLVLEIHQVTKEHEGVYMCIVSKSSINASTPCNLIVHALNSTTTFTSPQNSNNLNNTASPEDASYVFIVPIVLGGVVVATVIIIIFKRKTLLKQFHKSCCLTDKFHIATNDPSSQQQATLV